MKLLKQSVYILILLLVVVVAWVGFSAYFQTRKVEINPNAQNYTRSISPNFDTEEIQGVSSRIEESFPVSPEEFFLLTEQEN